MKHTEPTITAFDWAPDFAQGNVRDLRLRWALEEASRPYEVEVLTQGDQKKAANLARQPFGQAPVMQTDDDCLFESGAIVWRIAEASTALLPGDTATRDRMFCWYFAALNTVEPDIMMLATLDFFVGDKEAASKVRPDVAAAVEMRLKSLQDALDEEDFLVGGFTAADLMMATVLRILKHTDIVAGFQTLERYLDRCTDRPAFRKALDDQLRTFAENAPRYEKAG